MYTLRSILLKTSFQLQLYYFFVCVQNALEWWFTLGVDGFNLHGMAYIYEDEERQDEPINPDFDGDPAEEPVRKKFHNSILLEN